MGVEVEVEVDVPAQQPTPRDLAGEAGTLMDGAVGVEEEEEELENVVVGYVVVEWAAGVGVARRVPPPRQVACLQLAGRRRPRNRAVPTTRPEVRRGVVSRSLPRPRLLRPHRLPQATLRRGLPRHVLHRRHRRSQGRQVDSISEAVEPVWMRVVVLVGVSGEVG